MLSRNTLYRLALGLVVVVLLTSAGEHLRGFAQSTGDSWTEPINLSKSGSSLDPVAVVDSNGQIHVIWKDEFADWVYTSGDSTEFAQPVAAEYTFGERVPRLYADAGGNIHALWIDEEGALYQGWAQASAFGSPGSWSGTQLLGASAAGYDMARDAQGGLHLAYVRNLDTADFPAGVYYLKSTNNGASWSNPVNLYASAYMRSLTEENANVDVSVTDVGGAQDVYIAWDNPPLKRVLLVKSEDGGQTWGDTLTVDGPTSTTVTSAPFRVKVNPDGQNVLLVWNSALQSDFDCTQYSQFSTDGGRNWSERQVMFEDFVGCPQDNQFVQGEAGLTILMTTIRDEVFLTAWDGARWSTPQPQAILFRFTNQENFNSVDFRCRQTLKSGPERITVVGCDLAGGGDIWAISSQIGPLEDWFPPPTAWTKPEPLTIAEVADGSVTVLNDTNGAFHAIWNQLDESKEGAPKWKVYYARQEDEQWSEPVAVLDSPGGSVEAPSAVIDPENRLFVVWRASQTGEIYYSWASAGLAISTFEWVSPQVLPMPQVGGSSPDVLVDQNGELVVAYAVPVNEGRGIYLTRTADAGTTWSTPVQAFDGAASGWVMVDHPRLAITDGGVLHLIWTRNLLGEVNRPVALYYAKSTDGGQSWSEPELVADQPIQWADIYSSGSQEVHRLWQGTEGEISSLWDQYSLNDGETWSQPANLTRFGETPGPASLATDSLGRLNLLQAVSDVNNKVSIQHWTWENEVWNDQPALKLGNASELKITSLGANTAPDGRLDTVFAQDDLLDNLATEVVLVAGRQSVLVSLAPATQAAGTEVTQPAPVTPAATATPESIPTGTSAPANLSTGTAAPALTPTITPTLQTGPVSMNSRLSGPVIGGILALLVVGLAAGLTLVVVRRSARKR